ncbi:carboxypeptidase-like regulatory domain-containing protein [Psychroflexus tropicus]|uniref:carboxypeptidase-like regulatory domain-containing protein n=1 Tax=Psychroflexus tropicus TaxID=197345 RepID=UPI00036ACF50|nr:carboxypeptidase-like regulatory domain-containing protein [Psychroflexus tropicus]
MKSYLTGLFLILFVCVQGQSIDGKIVDKNNKPLSNATVYFDGSTTGTLSRSDGSFTIQTSNRKNLILVVRYIGYETVYIKDPDPETTYQIELSVQENFLDEVVLESSLFSRKQMLKAFKRDFLGETRAGRRSKILNEDDLTFYYDKNDRMLLASSKNPIKIENKELGYLIEFDLIDFISEFSSLSLHKAYLRSNFFSGTSFFQELDDNSKYEKKRKKTYYGSPKHFFKSLTSRQLEENNFELYDNSFRASVDSIFKVLSVQNGYEITILKNDLDRIKSGSLPGNSKFQKKITILNKNDRSDVSFKTETFFVDKYGNHTHIDQILFYGEMSKRRVGDMLPINYKPDE